MLKYETKTFGDLPGAMCDSYNIMNTSDSLPLANFQTLMNFKGSYGTFYAEPHYEQGRMDYDHGTSVYHELLSPKEYPEHWRTKFIADWTPEDTRAWILEVAHGSGIRESDIPLSNFRDYHGIALRGLTRLHMHNLMYYEGVDKKISKRNADIIYNALEMIKNEEPPKHESVIRSTNVSYPSYQYNDPGYVTLTDLDRCQLTAPDYEFPHFQQQVFDSGDDTEEHIRPYDSASPELSYGSDASKCSDELDDKSKVMKRPPGRPKGSGKKNPKRVKNVSVPVFLRDMILDPKYCPQLIKWENYAIGQFRFVKPDEVAKLWGKKKNNENMTFEKLSRAMRYHYRQKVLQSVPTARLVYQFGKRGPNYETDDPNFEKFRALHVRGAFSGSRVEHFLVLVWSIFWFSCGAI